MKVRKSRVGLWSRGSFASFGLLLVVILLSGMDDDSSFISVSGARDLLSSGDGGGDCRKVRHVPEKDKCSYSRHECGDIKGVLVSYISLRYCTLKSVPNFVFYIIATVLTILLFYLLGDTAEAFFCESLERIADSLRLSPNVAGVTFLALGNGAPDIFSIVAGILSGSSGIGFGIPIGAGIFVTTVVMGEVALFSGQSVVRVTRRPFLRDIGFYLVAVVYVFYTCMDGKVTLGESAAFVVYYFVYVGVVLLGRVIYQWNKKRKLRASEMAVVEEEEDVLDDSSSDDSMYEEGIVLNIERKEDEVLLDYESEKEVEGETAALLGEGKLSENDGIMGFVLTEIGWEEKSWWERILYLVLLPFIIVRNLTTPRIGENWNKYFSCSSIILAPPFVVFLVGVGWMWILIVCGVFTIPALLLYWCVFPKDPKEEPKSEAVMFLIISLEFCISVAWIYLFACELVALLQTVGIIAGISDAVMGLTVLSWGNSVGDVVADLVVARQGYAGMAIGAVYGGSMFNLLLGLGMGFTIVNTMHYPKPFHVSMDKELEFAFMFLGLILVLPGIVVPLSQFRVTKAFGCVLLVLYVVFLVGSFLVTFGAI